MDRYIQYEERLEALRVHRKEERGMAGKHTLSEWAIPRRIHFIYDRALRRFKGDLDLWTRWLHHCRTANSPRQLSKVGCCGKCDALSFQQRSSMQPVDIKRSSKPSKLARDAEEQILDKLSNLAVAGSPHQIFWLLCQVPFCRFLRLLWIMVHN